MKLADDWLILLLGLVEILSLKRSEIEIDTRWRIEECLTSNCYGLKDMEINKNKRDPKLRFHFYYRASIFLFFLFNLANAPHEPNWTRKNNKLRVILFLIVLFSFLSLYFPIRSSFHALFMPLSCLFQRSFFFSFFSLSRRAREIISKFQSFWQEKKELFFKQRCRLN